MSDYLADTRAAVSQLTTDTFGGRSKPKEKWHAGRMIFALAQHFDWFHNHMMTEYFVGGGIADLAFISKAGYLTEVEIKISKSDWNADQDKRKWKCDRRHVARFFYAVPAHLSECIPDWVPETAGILSVKPRGRGYDQVQLIRMAKRTKCEPLPPREIQNMIARCYHRYWKERMRTLGLRLAKERTMGVNES